MEFIRIEDPNALESLSKQKATFFCRAVDLATMSTERQKHGAIITSGRRVLGVGVNTYRNDPRTTTDIRALSWHAEVNALRQLHKHYPSLTAFVARVNNQGELRPSMPCPSCRNWLREWNVRTVYYS